MINDKELYTRSLWDWDFLRECFGTSGIRLSDIDGVVERNGRFLFIEAKGPTAPIKTGQLRMLKQLAAIPGMTVLVLWGEPAQPQEMMLVGWERRSCTTEDVRRLVSSWFESADAITRGAA